MFTREEFSRGQFFGAVFDVRIFKEVSQSDFTDYYNDLEDDIAEDETEKKTVDDAERAEAECLNTLQVHT